MPRRHSIELLPDDASAAVVRRQWEALREAGIPSMADHTGESNTPHVTVVAVPGLTEDDERRAVDALGPLLPVTARVAGLVTFGDDPLVLARVVELPDPVVVAVLGLRAAVGDDRFAGWLPHLTLGMRVPRDRLAEAQDLARGEDEVVFAGLRRWDPDEKVVRTLLP
ncbi:2'-5' RNA ligase family protein [Nocardioides litoris]|uniref:2'-5' RNA ligase family protein n=1 Tax=Nocardioides litoris TaxID=1926648 RepID=UPI00111E6068|nr:2'-5' RNA ligase family protein [Nocardioides litoris]